MTIVNISLQNLSFHLISKLFNVYKPDVCCLSGSQIRQSTPAVPAKYSSNALSTHTYTFPFQYHSCDFFSFVASPRPKLPPVLLHLASELSDQPVDLSGNHRLVPVPVTVPVGGDWSGSSFLRPACNTAWVKREMLFCNFRLHLSEPDALCRDRPLKECLSNQSSLRGCNINGQPRRTLVQTVESP